MIALVQRKRRKTHLAASIDITQEWAPLCSAASAPMSTCTFQSIDAAAATIAPDDTTVCVYCRRMIAFVHILNRIDSDGTGRRHLRSA